MRFALAVPFGILGETLEFPDPWNTPGVQLSIERRTTRKHQAWSREKSRKSPIFSAGLKALALAREGDSPEDFLRGAVERGEIGPDVVLGFDKPEEDASEASALLRGWSGVTDEGGAPVPFSPEAVDELLHCDALVPEDRRYVGKDGTSRATVGACLVQYILDRSLDIDSYREEALGKIGKN